LHKRLGQKQVGVLEKLYSGSFERFTTQFPSILQWSPKVKACATHKIYRSPAIIKFWRHTHLPIDCNVKEEFKGE